MTGSIVSVSKASCTLDELILALQEARQKYGPTKVVVLSPKGKPKAVSPDQIYPAINPSSPLYTVCIDPYKP